jgi:esterase
MDESTEKLLRLLGAQTGVEVPRPLTHTQRAMPGVGVRLNVYLWGAAEAPPLLFLHGGCLTARSWDLCCASQSIYNQCVAVDLRGHGDSDWAPDGDYRLDTFAADIEQVIDTVCISPPVLVGSSLGGLVALCLATRQRVEIAGVVAVEAGLVTYPAALQSILDFVRVGSAPDTFEGFVARALAFNHRRRRDILEQTVGYNLRRTGDGAFTWKWDPDRVSAAGLARLAEEQRHLADDLGEVDVPVLVVRGADSRMLPARDADELAARLPLARVEAVPHAGHAVHGDNPRDFLAAVRPFVAECERPRT